MEDLALRRCQSRELEALGSSDSGYGSSGRTILAISFWFIDAYERSVKVEPLTGDPHYRYFGNDQNPEESRRLVEKLSRIASSLGGRLSRDQGGDPSEDSGIFGFYGPSAWVWQETIFLFEETGEAATFLEAGKDNLVQWLQNGTLRSVRLKQNDGVVWAIRWSDDVKGAQSLLEELGPVET